MKINEDRYSADLENHLGDTFKKCVDIFRPVHKYIKKLSKKDGDVDEKERTKYLCKLGDHITSHVEKMNIS